MHNRSLSTNIWSNWEVSHDKGKLVVPTWTSTVQNFSHGHLYVYTIVMLYTFLSFWVYIEGTYSTGPLELGCLNILFKFCVYSLFLHKNIQPPYQMIMMDGWNTTRTHALYEACFMWLKLTSFTSEVLQFAFVAALGQIGPAPVALTILDQPTRWLFERLKEHYQVGKPLWSMLFTPCGDSIYLWEMACLIYW